MTRNMYHLWTRPHDTLKIVGCRHLFSNCKLSLRLPYALSYLVELLINPQRLIKVDEDFLHVPILSLYLNFEQ
jgi:hypothetical protein